MNDAKPKKEKRAPIMVVRVGHQIRPLDGLAATDLERFPQNKPLRCEITQARSVPQNRLYRALLQKTVENFPEDPFGQSEPMDADTLHEWVKHEVGYTRPVRDRFGNVRHVARSIAFDEMDQPTFKVFFDRVKDLIETRFFPGINSEAFEAEIRSMLAPAERLAA